MSRCRNFLDACLAGDAIVSDVDDWVERWHSQGGAPDGHSQSLGQFLGLDGDEYALWVERPESLRFVLAARKGRSPNVAGVKELAAAAARATDDQEAVGVVAWLRETGRLD